MERKLSAVTRHPSPVTRHPSPVTRLGVLLPRDLVVLDLLVQVGARRVDHFRRPADVPAVLAQFRNEELALGVFLELRKRGELQAALGDSAPGGYWWMSAFGAGVSCHGALLEVE